MHKKLQNLDKLPLPEFMQIYENVIAAKNILDIKMPESDQNKSKIDTNVQTEPLMHDQKELKLKQDIDKLLDTLALLK